MRDGLLDDVPAAERQQVLELARRRTFRRNEVVFHRGDPADSLHLVVNGRFGVQTTTPYGDTLLFSVVRRGQFFGELALIEPGASRSATVMALDAAETRSIHRVEFDALRARRPEVANVLIAVLAERVRHLSELLVDATFASAETRVLRRLAEAAGGDAGGDGVVKVPLTQEQLGQLAGTSRATVNRILNEAAGRGEIEVRRGRIGIVDGEALERRCRRR